MGPVIDFKGDDPLDFKLDKMCNIAIVLGFFLVGIPATWIFCKVTCFVCDGLCFVLCCCTHETKIIEVSEEEWARLKKEKKSLVIDLFLNFHYTPYNILKL